MRTLRFFFSLSLIEILTSLSLVVTSTAVLIPRLMVQLTGLVFHLNHLKSSRSSWNNMQFQTPGAFLILAQSNCLFSPVHGTFSRIDFFLIDNKLLSSVTSYPYNPIVISDHAAVVMDVSLPGRSLSRSHWRFNLLLLSDTNFISTINSRIDLFISTNVSPDVSAAAIWESCKAYLKRRNNLIQPIRKRLLGKKKVSLSKDISEL